MPPSAIEHQKIRLKVKSLPPPPAQPPPTTTITKAYQCKYCSYETPWLKDISQHEMQCRYNCSSYLREDIVHNSNNGLSALIIDNVQSYGEILSNGNNEMIAIEDDDDEDDAYENCFLLL